MSHTLTDEDFESILNECLEQYKTQLDVKLHRETQKQAIEKILNKEALLTDLYWFAVGYRDAVKLIFEKLGKGEELKQKESELFKKMATENPKLLEKQEDYFP